MLRKGVRGLVPLATGQAAFFTSSAAALGAPAIADAKTTGGGFLAKLLGGGGSSRLSVPLTDALAVEGPTPVPPPGTRPTTQMTTLPNGVRVASEATLGPTVSMGLYVDSGSIYEWPHNTGISHLLEYMAFKSTVNRTHFRLVREVETIGANVVASASREQMAYTVDAAGVNAPEALELLADSVLNPAFNAWEVDAAVAKLRGDLAAARDNPQAVMLEAQAGEVAHPLGQRGRRQL